MFTDQSSIMRHCLVNLVNFPLAKPAKHYAKYGNLINLYFAPKILSPAFLAT